MLWLRWLLRLRRGALLWSRLLGLRRISWLLSRCSLLLRRLLLCLLGLRCITLLWSLLRCLLGLRCVTLLRSLLLRCIVLVLLLLTLLLAIATLLSATLTTAIEHLHFVSIDLCLVAILTGRLILPLAGLQFTFDIYLRTFLKVLACDFR